MANNSSSRCRILHVCTELSVGGVENHLIMLLRGLIQSGRYEPHIAAFRDATGAMRSLRQDFEAIGVPVHILGQDKAYDARGTIRLGRLLQQLKPAVLHTHLFRGDIYGPPVGALVGVPVRISTVHNVEERFRKRVFRPLFRFSYLFDHCIIAISDAVASALHRFLGLLRSKIKRIYYGFDPQARWENKPIRSLRSEFGFTPDDLVIGNIGRISVQKGQSYLIRAVDLVRRELPNVKLLIVGTPEPDGTYENLRSMVAQLGLEERVVFAGYRDDIGSVLATVDIFALPSLWEGFGLVLLEAMSMGKPIIASNVDSIPEIVEDGVQGILVPPRDVEALAKAIMQLACSPELRDRMAAAGPHRVERFSVQRMVDETIELYDSLLTNRQIVSIRSAG